MTPEQRLAMIPRLVSLLRGEIEKNGNRYHGGMVPNLMSITDMCTIGDEYLYDTDEAIAKLERERGIV